VTMVKPLVHEPAIGEDGVPSSHPISIRSILMLSIIIHDGFQVNSLVPSALATILTLRSLTEFIILTMLDDLCK
jgi:hypothetical protein